MAAAKIEKLILYAVTVLLIGFATDAIEPNEVLFVVLSQPDKYSSNLAEELKSSLLQQAEYMNKKQPIVLLSHETFPSPSSWTVLPILPELVRSFNNSKSDTKISWVFICEDRTEIKLKGLLKTLQDYDRNKELWIGHSLYDREASIIHHFAFFENPTNFKYPHMGTGIALTMPLVRRVSKRVLSHHNNNSTSDFSIDGSHELALFIQSCDKELKLKHDRRFCAKFEESEEKKMNFQENLKENECYMYPRPFKACGPPVSQQSLFFAVKTCEKFHLERLPVVKTTWGKRAENVKYFSEKEDPSIPTIGLNVQNTDLGHCAKTLAIFSRIYQDLKKDEKGSVKWIVLADDDTILSVSRIRELLSCYDPTIAAVIGERYGYNLQSTQGYNYITGGGGMILTLPLLESIVSRCKCPSPKSPDDMLVGLCLARLGLVITHSPYFHQARPVDYAPEYLKSSRQISFHKHWMIDPIQVYEEWFSAADLKMTQEEHQHVEL